MEIIIKPKIDDLNNSVIEVPKWIENLSQSKLITLPSAIGKLSKLQKLNLYATNVTDLPTEIGNLLSLLHIMKYLIHCFY